MSKKEQGKTMLLIIDPQRDFHIGGPLAVPGADDDSGRISKIITNNEDRISEIFVTLDSHHRNHISNGIFWLMKDPENENKMIHPPPFTNIYHKDILDGKYVPADINLSEHCHQYTKAVEEKNRFTHMIFPEHCLIGSVGHAVVQNIHDAIQKWSLSNMKSIKYVMKGQNCLTEMYSAIEAEVPLRLENDKCIYIYMIFWIRLLMYLVKLSLLFHYSFQLLFHYELYFSQ